LDPVADRRRGLLVHAEHVRPRGVALLELRGRAVLVLVEPPLHAEHVGAVDLAGPAEVLQLRTAIAVELRRQLAVLARVQRGAAAGAVRRLTPALAVGGETGVDAARVGADRGQAGALQPLAQVHVGRGFPRHAGVRVGIVRLLERQAAVRAPERAPGLAAAPRQLAGQARAPGELEREVRAAQAVVAGA